MVACILIVCYVCAVLYVDSPGWLGKRARRCGWLHVSWLSVMYAQFRYVDSPEWLEKQARRCGWLRVSWLFVMYVSFVMLC